MIIVPLDVSPTHCVNCGHRATYLVVGARIMDDDDEQRERLINRVYPCRCILRNTPVRNHENIIDDQTRMTALRIALAKVKEFVT